MDQPKTKAEAEVVSDLARKAIRPTVIDLKMGTHEGAQVLLVPQGLTATPVKPLLDPYRTAPERREGTAKLATLGSLIDHVNRFKDEHSALFADPDPKTPKLLGVLDYHEQTHEGAPRWGKHRALYQFPLSEEWTSWTSRNKSEMAQAAFASFVEQRVVDVAEPTTANDRSRDLVERLGIDLASPSRLMELSRGLSVQVGRRVINVVNLQTGEGHATFAEEHRDTIGAELKIPSAFLIAIPVFRDGDPYQLLARLRYRLREGEITWWYDLHRPDFFFDHAFRTACEGAKAGTKCPLFYGTPES